MQQLEHYQKNRDFLRNPIKLGDNRALLCPYCNDTSVTGIKHQWNEYTHQGSVELLHANYTKTEDSFTIGLDQIKIDLSGQEPDITVKKEIRENELHTYLRDGYYIDFRCEQGGHNFKVAIIQHKGMTYLSYA
jgi:hypothetical protein